jgi:hypothetical protein
MNTIKISFLSLSKSVDFEMKSEKDNIDQIFNDFISAFITSVDYENFKINIDTLQQNTAEFRTKLDCFIQKYKIKEPKFQQLNSYLKDLKDNEYFFFIPNITLSKEQSFQLYNYLSALNENVDFEKHEKQMNDLFGRLRESYDMFVFGGKIKNKIGELDKSKRVCRFCNKSEKDVTFKKVAHTISEALGNKKIITNDECDSCNEKFGKGIENDLILYLDLYRNIFATKGKNGIPKLKGKNFEIETVITETGKTKIKQILTDEEVNDPNRNDFKLKLETNKKLVAQNIYRTLVKYALGVIDKKCLEHFSETIEWIKGNTDFQKLPKVAILTSYDLFLNHPQIMVYLRKTDDGNLPYAVAEFGFTFLRFVYIIPATNKDIIDFITDENYNKFWNFFKHYSSIPNWTFKKMNDNVARFFTMNINFEKHKS